MAEFEVTTPDGKKFTVSNVDEGATNAQILERVKSQESGSKVAGDVPLTEKIPSEDEMSAGEGFMTGVADVPLGAKQFVTHVTGSGEEAKTVDKAMQEREADIERRGGGGWSRTAGNVVGGAPVAAAAGAVGGLPGAAIGGFLSGAFDPVTSGNFVEEKLQQSLLGTAFGTGIGAGGKVLGNLIAPTVRPGVQKLLQSGVQMTPGQIAGAGRDAGMVGQTFRRLEEAAKSVPLLGSFIRASEGRGIESWDKGTINQVLEPINESLGKNTSAGHAAIREAYDKLSSAYDNVLPKLNLHVDPDLATDIGNTRYRASADLPEAQFKQFESLLKARVVAQMVKGPMSGGDLKQVESGLRAFANEYRTSADAAQRQLAYFVDDIRGSLRDGLIRQNPKEADTLKNIDKAYSMFTRIEQAASRGATHYGVFTPNDLLQSIKQQDKTMRKGAFARGDSLLQLWAETGHEFLAPKMPDSGTPERLMSTVGAGALGAAGILNPKLLAAGAAIAPYTKAGQKAVGKMAQPGPTRQAVGSAVKKATPYLATEGSQAGTDLFQSEADGTSPPFRDQRSEMNTGQVLSDAAPIGGAGSKLAMMPDKFQVEHEGPFTEGEHLAGIAARGPTSAGAGKAPMPEGKSSDLTVSVKPVRSNFGESGEGSSRRLEFKDPEGRVALEATLNKHGPDAYQLNHIVNESKWKAEAGGMPRYKDLGERAYLEAAKAAKAEGKKLFIGASGENSRFARAIQQRLLDKGLAVKTEHEGILEMRVPE